MLSVRSSQNESFQPLDPKFALWVKKEVCVSGHMAQQLSSWTKGELHMPTVTSWVEDNLPVPFVFMLRLLLRHFCWRGAAWWSVFLSHPQICAIGPVFHLLICNLTHSPRSGFDHKDFVYIGKGRKHFPIGGKWHITQQWPSALIGTLFIVVENCLWEGAADSLWNVLKIPL